MESGRKKRRMVNKNEEEKEDDDEEEKVEKFFALIRSTREMRDRLRNVPNEEEEKKKQEQKLVWNPTFQPEDFMEDSKSKNIPLQLQPGLGLKDIAGPSSKTEQEEQKTKEEGEDGGLDLNLSL